MPRATLKHIALGGAPTAVSMLELTLADPQSFAFDAGQYSAIQLPNGSALTLSIASGPTRLPMVRFLYKPTPGDPDSEALNEQLLSATTLELQLPGGQVRWDTTVDVPSLLICAGTGIAQAFSILETVADRAPERLARYEVLALAGSAAEQMSHPEETSWTDAGLELIRINDAALGADNAGLVWLKTAAERLIKHQARVLIGGGPAFVYAVHDTLTAAGLDASRFSADVYEYAPR